jgi:hypothetical protein
MYTYVSDESDGTAAALKHIKKVAGSLHSNPEISPRTRANATPEKACCELQKRTKNAAEAIVKRSLQPSSVMRPPSEPAKVPAQQPIRYYKVEGSSKKFAVKTFNNVDMVRIGGKWTNLEHY